MQPVSTMAGDLPAEFQRDGRQVFRGGEGNLAARRRRP
jgi:hypothetical protein